MLTIFSHSLSLGPTSLSLSCVHFSHDTNISLLLTKLTLSRITIRSLFFPTILQKSFSSGSATIFRLRHTPNLFSIYHWLWTEKSSILVFSSPLFCIFLQSLCVRIASEQSTVFTSRNGRRCGTEGEGSARFSHFPPSLALDFPLALSPSDSHCVSLCAQDYEWKDVTMACSFYSQPVLCWTYSIVGRELRRFTGVSEQVTLGENVLRELSPESSGVGHVREMFPLERVPLISSRWWQVSHSPPSPWDSILLWDFASYS